MADRVGQQLGNYRLLTLLGKGGFAEVYLGQHLRFNQQAAIKLLHMHLIGTEAEHFRYEAETIALLAHPGIVRVFDFDVQEGAPFLVLEYAPNGSLRRRHPKGEVVPLPTLNSYVKQVADALQYAHEHKIIHRDVKPENMLVGRQQEVLLSDFGLATLAQSTSQLSRSAQGTAGTIAYMAPEQIEGHPRAASDQYALGVVVYEWLCGARPFEGSMSEVMVQHLGLPPPPLRERVPTLSAEIEQVTLQALAKDPEQRFASMQDFALALEEACRTEVSSGHTLLVLSSASPAIDRHASKHNLPAQLTQLIGREQEVAAVQHLLHREDVRLVTLTGAGGIGKTRLGLQVAAELSDLFPDGVYFVNLAPLSDPTLVVSTIAQVIDLKETGEQPLLDLLTGYLQDKQLLLLLDNFEQVAGAALQVADLLVACPKLKIIVTSRAVLHIRGEQEFPVPPLEVPDPKHLPDLVALSQYEAVVLFIKRAQAIKPEFQVTNANAPAVAEICVRLDGLPLAIELAAARIKVLPPQALLARLGQRLAVLTDRAKDVPARQQTLRNTIEWSYQLLDAQDQQLFRWLSVFVGGCTLEAIEAICDALENNNGAVSVLDGVASLIDQSLLQQTELVEPRLVMLETIREYGMERLTSSGEWEETQKAYADYYLWFSEEEVEPQLRGPWQVRLLQRLELEHGNLRAALRWFLEQGSSKQNIEKALRLGAALRSFWLTRGYYSEGQTFLEQALASSEGIEATVRAKALSAAATLAGIQGDMDRAESLSKESLSLCRELGERTGIAYALYQLGSISSSRGDLAASRQLSEEALALRRELGNKQDIASSLINVAAEVSEQGEYNRGRALFEESLALFRELGNIRGIALSLLGLAEVLFVSQSDSATIPSLLEEGIDLLRELDDTNSLVDSLILLGELALHQGDASTARSLAEEGVALSREIGDRLSRARSLAFLAKVLAHQGDQAAARAMYEESLALAKAGNPPKWRITPCMEGLAGVLVSQGELVWAARLWGAAEALRDAMGTPIPPVYRAEYERSVAAARDQLGEQVFTAAWAEGRNMTPEQALAAQGPVTLPQPFPAAQSSTPQAQSPITSPGGLSARELEVLRLLATGLTDAQIAEQLVLSLYTIHAHLRTIYSKLGVTSRSAATRYAFEHQLV